MRKLLILLVGTAVAVTVLVGLRDRSHPAATLRPAVTTPVTATSPPPPSYRTGTALGEAVATDYGVVQVKVTARNGRIASVMAVRIPDRDPMDVQLSRP